jgi:1L-myo-inositol 1-phosphate cytidylyltransferase
MDHPIKCAVVIAAGFGSRLRDGDDAGPKPLRRVESVPLLVRVLRCLAASGIEQAAVVLGYQADQIRAALEQETGLGLSLSYVLNEEYAKSNGVSVLAARQFVGQGCVLSMADHLYSPRVVSAVLSPEFASGSSVLGVDYEIERCFDLDDATKVQVEGGRIVEIAKTLDKYNALDSGVFRIGPSLIEALDSVYREKGDCSLSDGVRALTRRGEFFASDIGGACWIDVDTPESARHAALLLRVLGDDLEGSFEAPLPGMPGAFPGIHPSFARRRPVLDATARLAGRFAAPPDAE